jgi:hypothetical protein
MTGNWLYDPAVGGVLVRAHRPASSGAMTCVVSDVVWTDVLQLLRWADAALRAGPDLLPGTAWRTAAAAAALLRRMPGLCAELGVDWPGPARDPERAGIPARERVRAAAARLSARLRATGRVTSLPDLAGDVDALGAAATALLAERADWSAVR